MKKILTAVLAVLFAIALPAFAAEVKMPPSALSTESPNKDKPTVVAEFKDMKAVVAGTKGDNPQVLTMEILVSNHPTIGSLTAGPLLCEVESIADPVPHGNGICVMKQQKPATVTVADFKHGSGKAQNEHTMSAKDFFGAKATVPANGVDKMKCLVVNGKSTGICKIASNQH